MSRTIAGENWNILSCFWEKSGTKLWSKIGRCNETTNADTPFIVITVFKVNMKNSKIEKQENPVCTRCENIRSFTLWSPFWIDVHRFFGGWVWVRWSYKKSGLLIRRVGECYPKIAKDVYSEWPLRVYFATMKKAKWKTRERRKVLEYSIVVSFV